MRFAQLNISILQEKAKVYFSNVLLKIICVLHVHRRYIKIQPSLFCKNETVSAIPWLFVNLLISRFTNITRNKRRLYLLTAAISNESLRTVYMLPIQSREKRPIEMN